MIIDFHTHIFPPAFIKNRAEYLESDLCFAELYSSPKARMITAEKLIEDMDAAEIDKAVVLNIGWRSLPLCVETNNYIMESAAKYPKRLIGFCGLPQLSAMESVAELQRCIQGGIKGIGEVRPDIEADLMDEYGTAYFLEMMKANKLTLLVHASEPVGHDYSGKGMVTPAVIELLAQQLPDINVVCAHWGGGLPFYTLMPDVKKLLSRVYYDSAASPFLYSPKVYSTVAGLAGADKVLFGSDYPLMPYKKVLDEINGLEMDAEEKDRLLYKNAAKLLGIKAGK